MEEEQIVNKAMELIGIGCLPMALKAAIELNVLEILSEAGPETMLSASQIVSKLPTNNPKAGVTLDRILRLLASHSIFETDLNEKGERLYGLTTMCKYLLPNQDGVSFSPLIVMVHDKVLMGTWHHLKDAVLEGCSPFTKAHGISLFEYFATDLRVSKVFNAGMSAHSTSAMRELLENFRGFEGLNMLVDVGGGIGSSLKMILSKYPHIKGINFDLPHVIVNAPACPGIEHVAGDMFEKVPSGDAIFIKWILHDWDDERGLKVLKNCWKALPEHGKVILVEFILLTDNVTDPTARRVINSDLTMLAYNEGGKERTFGEYEALAKEAGFSSVKAFPYSHGLAAIELYKKA